MREGTNRLRIGALVLGVGLAISVAAPALAQDVPGITTDADENTVTITTDDYIVTADDPSTISGPETRTGQEIFTDDLLACIADIGVSDSLEGVLENVLNEEETDPVDDTPLNPADTTDNDAFSGTEVTERVHDCEATPPL